MSEKILVKEVLIPKKANKVDYFKAAVYRIITPGKLVFGECEKAEHSTLNDPKITAMIKQAVPGYRSYLLRLEIDSNINQHILDDATLSTQQKVERISEGIRKYVIV